MATLSELIQEHAALPPADEEWLRLLVSDWQLLSDLSFADLVLWVRSAAGQWQAVAHIRPTTGQTVYFRDQVGRLAGPSEDRSGSISIPTRATRCTSGVVSLSTLGALQTVASFCIFLTSTPSVDGPSKTAEEL